MDETEWSTCMDPTLMLRHLTDAGGGGASPRKLRLFAVDCCRRHAEMLVPETTWCLEVAERFAEGQVGQAERRAARERAFRAPWHESRAFAHRRGPAKACVTSALARRAFDAATCASHVSRAIGVPAKDWAGGRDEQKVRQANSLRDIFGNPFRPVRPDRPWLDPAVVSLASAVYEGSAFDRMPALADALQAAGCADRDVLDHCRGPGPHARGCWVVDLVLGKA